MKQVKLVPTPADELDISALFRQAFSFFRQYGKLLLVVAFVGLLAGFIRFWKTPNLYTSSMVLQPTILSDPEQMALIKNWSALLTKKEFHVLANELDLEVPLLKKVQSIKTEELQKSYSPNNFTAFTLSVIVRDTAILQPLQKGMVHALNNSSFVKDKLALHKNNMRSLVQIVDQEITRLKSMQQTVENNLQRQSNTGGSLMLNVSGISEQIADLRFRKFSYEEELSNASAVHVLQNFYIPSRPTFPVLLKQLALGVCAGVFLGCTIAFYLHYKKNAQI
jgi:capsular polysaccharide biosynthesis protein